MSKPSFFSLFKRGRYSAPDASGDEDNPEAAAQLRSKRNEQERFTAAALAFCFKHDSTFRQHFWERICRSDGDPDTPDSIELEPRHSADLLVRSGGPLRRIIHVVECKVGADLKPHQDPGDPVFSTNGGYGFKLRQHEGEQADLRYIVLGLRRTLNLPEPDPTLRIRFAQRQWSDLECCEPATALMTDLFNSLGEMRIGKFHMRKTKGLPPINTGLKSIGNAWAVIGDTLRGFEIHSGWKIEGGSRSNEESYLGAYVHSGYHAQLQEVTQSTGPYLLWLGYYAKADDSVQRLVYLYCADELRTQWLKAALTTDFPNAFTDKEDHQLCVVISDESASGISDLEWFSSVLKKAAQLAGDKS